MREEEERWQSVSLSVSCVSQLASESVGQFASVSCLSQSVSRTVMIRRSGLGCRVVGRSGVAFRSIVGRRSDSE